MPLKRMGKQELRTVAPIPKTRDLRTSKGVGSGGEMCRSGSESSWNRKGPGGDPSPCSGDILSQRIR